MAVPGAFKANEKYFISPYATFFAILAIFFISFLLRFFNVLLERLRLFERLCLRGIIITISQKFI